MQTVTENTTQRKVIDMKNEREITYAEAIEAMRTQRFLMSLQRTKFPSQSGMHPSVLELLREKNINPKYPENAIINEVLWAVETVYKKKQFEKSSDRRKAHLIKQMSAGSIK